MQLSQFGTTLGGPTGIMDLMDDMGRALAGGEKTYMLGGGNPAHVPEIDALWRARLEEILREPGATEAMLGNYDAPQGRRSFLDAVAELLHREYGWELTAENVAVTYGSQTAFFLLLNMFSGRRGYDDLGASDRLSGNGVPGGHSDAGRRSDAGGRNDAGGRGGRDLRRILFPLQPEYIGYADQGLHPDAFASCRPIVERIDEHTHKYRIDFDAVEQRLSRARRGDDPAIGAICVSRPTQPFRQRPHRCGTFASGRAGALLRRSAAYRQRLRCSLPAHHL